MTSMYFHAMKQAIAELKSTGAAFLLFELNGKWYELKANSRKPKLVCGALKKAGDRCRCKALHRGGKCKFHGGLSTGAKTPEGKARSIAAMQMGRLKWLAALPRLCTPVNT